MTAWDLVQQYIREHDNALPPVGMEYVEINAYANRLNGDTPESDSIIAVCQMLRQRRVFSNQLSQATKRGFGTYEICPQPGRKSV